MDDFRVIIAGRQWRVQFVTTRQMRVRAWGTCDSPPGRHPTIQIARSLRGKRLLEILVHESLHASIPLLEETAVDDTARDIARVLYLAGVRISEDVL